MTRVVRPARAVGRTALTDSAEAEARVLTAVVELCRALARSGSLTGLGVQMRDAIPRLELTTSSGMVVDVRVEDDGDHFVWRPAMRRHPVDDVPGAARRLCDYLAECGHRPPGGGR